MLLLSIHLFYGQSNVKNEYPSSFWLSLSAKEKISFVNGAYSAMSVLKNEHKKEQNEVTPNLQNTQIFLKNKLYSLELNAIRHSKSFMLP